MPFKIYSTGNSKSNPPADIQKLVDRIRRHRKKDVVDLGIGLIWKVFHGRDIEELNYSQRKIIEVYGPRVVLLALATANNYRNISTNTSQFYNFCNDHLGLPECISVPEFADEEAKKIVSELESSDWLDTKYINTEYIKESFSASFISRLLRMQHQGFNSSINEIYTDFVLLKSLNEATKGSVEEACQEVFNINLLQLYRITFCIFTIANSSSNAGRIDVSCFTAEQEVLDTFEITIEQIKSMAELLSYPEERLREEWFYKAKELHPVYQKYYPDPLVNQPLICEENCNKNKFIMPSPGSYTRSQRNFIFKKLLAVVNKPSLLGECIEKHIKIALENIFGSENVTKINHPGKHADLHVKLEKINLVIEIKTNFGSIEARSVMDPKDIDGIWNKLFIASEQCSESIKVLKNDEKITIPIVLIADHMTAESLSFQVFGYKTELFKDMQIDGIQFLSWNSIENCLSKTSVNEFENSIVDSYAQLSDATIADLLLLDFEKAESAHNYEYLTKAKDELKIQKIKKYSG